jgi:hypothetical protein
MKLKETMAKHNQKINELESKIKKKDDELK